MCKRRDFSILCILGASLAMFSAPAASETPKRAYDATTYYETITSLADQPAASGVEFCLAKAIRGNRIEITKSVERLVTEEIFEEGPTLASTGVKQPTRRVQTRAITETYCQQVPASAVKCRRIDGKEVPVKTMLQELACERPVIFSPEGKMIDSRFAKMFQPTTLVLFFRSGQTIAPETPTYAPTTISPVPANQPMERTSSNTGGGTTSQPTYKPRPAAGAAPRR